MGGPSNPFEIEIFLKNMFSDENILRIRSRFLRRIVGNFIVNKRLYEARKNYEAIGGKSPIVPITFSLVQKLNEKNHQIFYTYAMRYTPPYAKMVVQDLQSKEIEEVVLMSMYPQYSTTTTQSSIQDFQQACQDLRYSPSIKIIDRFYDHPLLLESIKNEIQRQINHKNSADYTLIFSVHGLPQSIIDSGDPYQKECEHQVRLLKSFLEDCGLVFAEVLLTYQSKIGPMKWLEPSTESVVKRMKGKKLILYPLAFTIDNSETSFELDIQLRKIAQENSIEEFLLCPCLNDSEDFVQLILNLTQGEKNEN